MRRFCSAAALFVAILILSVLCTSCRNGQRIPSAAAPIAQPFHALVPFELQELTTIHMLYGGSGERREIDDPQVIRTWIGRVQSQILTPDPNQEGRTGYRYHLNLLTNNSKAFAFTEYNMKHIYYLGNDDFSDADQWLWEQGKKIGEDVPF